MIWKLFRRRWSAALVLATAALVVAGSVPAAPQRTAATFDEVVNTILAEPYQPNYVPVGFDTAFPDPVLNIAPAQDYTSGSVPGDPDHPNWPSEFAYVRYLSGDGAPLRARVALHPGSHPGIVVAHGFNTNAKESVIRWAAMLYARGYNVIASDQRDFKDEYRPSMPPLASEGYPTWLQTFGWKEADDVLAAGAYLKSQPGVTSLGIVGFSEGAQNTVLALSRDTGGLFSAGLTFSPPADQNAQIYSTAVPQGCMPPSCTYPATNALILLVIPPYGSGGKYDDPCEVLTDVGAKYGVTKTFVLSQEKAYRAQTQITVPLLNFFSNDDSLVAPFHATMMAGYENGVALQRTYLVSRGEHAYFFDRWWQQRAILDYFGGLLPGAGPDLTPTVNQTPGGGAFSTQLVSLGNPTPQDADALQKPDVCPDGTTAVAVRSFTASGTGARVVLRWRTGTENGLAGFNLYAGQTRLNRALVRAAGNSAGHAYVWRGRAVAAKRYGLEVVRLDGTRTRQLAVRP